MIRRAAPKPQPAKIADLAERLLTESNEPLVQQTVLAVLALGGLDRAVSLPKLLSFTPLLDQVQNTRQSDSPDELIKRSIGQALESKVLKLVDSESDAFMVNEDIGAGGQPQGDIDTTSAAASPNEGRRPNAFEYYEKQVGLLTPIIADKIGNALRLYPDGWVEDAIDEATAHNGRNWRYVETILENWTTEGRSLETNQRDHEEHLDPGKYLYGRYAQLFRKR